MFQKVICALSLFAVCRATHHLADGRNAVVYNTRFLPPSADKLFVPSAKSLSGPTPYVNAYPQSPVQYPVQYPTQYPAQYNPQYSAKQFPYYPNAYPPPPYGGYLPFSPYPGAAPVVLVGRYPGPDQGSEQGGWASYFPASWQQFLGNIPSFGGQSESESPSPAPANPSPSEGGASGPSGTKEKPEKVEADEESGEAVKYDAGKPASEQQYVVVGQPQFFGHFASFPAGASDPSSITAASKGAISSFLFYRDQPQQLHQLPYQKPVESDNPETAAEAYQRFFLNRQKFGSSTTGRPSPSSETNSVAPAPTAKSSTGNQFLKSSDGPVAQSKPSALSYAGIGGTAGASPVATALSGPGGVSSTQPQATAIAGTSKNPPSFVPVPGYKQTLIPIARFTPQKGYHIQNLQ